jgi:hypothetical protein
MTGSGGEIASGLKTNNGVHTMTNMTLSGSGATTSYGICNGWRFAAPVVCTSPASREARTASFLQADRSRWGRPSSRARRRRPSTAR